MVEFVSVELDLCIQEREEVHAPDPIRAGCGGKRRAGLRQDAIAKQDELASRAFDLGRETGDLGVQLVYDPVVPRLVLRKRRRSLIDVPILLAGGEDGNRHGDVEAQDVACAGTVAVSGRDLDVGQLRLSGKGNGPPLRLNAPPVRLEDRKSVV